MDCQTISFYTLGCRLNQSETASIQNSFKEGGFKVVKFDEPADVVVINTCTVTENGDADARRLVQKANRINPKTRIALIGCQAQVQKEQLASLPNVRWIVGNSRKMDFYSILKKSRDDHSIEVIAPTITKEPFTIPHLSIDENHTRANLKVQDGCDFFCSFCEIPYARGRARSREFDDIILEAQALVAAKHKEVVITGINVGTYRYEGKTLIDVIEGLEKIEGLERIRISSIEPTTIDQRLIENMASKSKLCRYLHIPIQSGSNKMLDLMKRKYTVEEFAEYINSVHSAVEGICIGTDVIVGYPGETQEEFIKTETLLRELPIDYFHVFSYSERQMAKSKNSEGCVDKKVIQHRSKILRELSNRKREIFSRSQIGKEETVLFEQKKNGYFNGLTDTYCRIFVDSDNDLENQIERVKILDFKENKLYAQIVK